MPVSQIDSFLKTYLSALRDQTAAVFAGAGLSIPVGMVDWRGLLRTIAEDIGLDVDREHDLIAVAQYHVNERGGRNRINQALITQFAERAVLSDNHRLLAALPIHTYWTTNYDDLIERALREAHKRPDVKQTPENLAITLPQRDAVVYKIHGDVAHADKAVITRDDYEAFNETRQLFSIALQGDLVSKTFLFIGFSFNDPNLHYVLGRIRVLLGTNRREHYCLLRKVARGDFQDDADFHYAVARQELQVRDLRRYGIVGLLLDSYSMHTNILRRLVHQYRRNYVFISGSAAIYDPWSPDDAQDLLRLLGQRLIAEGFSVVTGFGLGIGPFLLNGILDGLEARGSYSFDDRVILRPFPQGKITSEQRAARWTAYRKEMISYAGIALFLFGNRRNSDGSLKDAKGVVEEFDLAVAAGVAVVPIGSTGFAAELLHKRILENFENYYPNRPELRPAFEALGRSKENIVDMVVQILKKLREGG
jgi:hypothetical protein